MALSRRERVIAIAGLVAVAVLVLDYFAVSPLLDANAVVKDRLEAARARRDSDAVLLHRRDEMAHTWDDMVAGGLMSNPSETVRSVLQALQGWAAQAGLRISNTTPERATQGGELREITVRVTANGGMAAVAGFLWRLESAKLPLRIKDVQIGGREGSDDLSLQMQVSTLYLAQPSTKAPAAAKATEEET